MLGGWVGGSLDRLVRGRTDPDLSASIEWARPAGRTTSVTIVKWRVQSPESALLTGWLDASPVRLPEVRRHGAHARSAPSYRARS